MEEASFSLRCKYNSFSEIRGGREDSRVSIYVAGGYLIANTNIEGIFYVSNNVRSLALSIPQRTTVQKNIKKMRLKEDNEFTD